MPLEWQPEYPDLIARKRIAHPSRTGRLTQPHDVRFAVGMVTFSYPDEIYTKKRRHASRQQTLAYNRFEPQPTDMAWMGQLPEMVIRKRMRTGQRLTFATGRDGVAATISPHLAWQPDYPDWISRERMPAYHQRFLLADPKPVFVNNDVRWLAEYPDWIYRRKYLTGQQDEWVGPQPTAVGPVIGKAWNVTYPDWIAPKKGLKPYLAQMFDLNTEPIPNPALVDNAWSPFFPDFASKRRMLTTHIPSAFWSNFTPDRVPYEWSNQRPDFGPRFKRNPFGGQVRPESEAPAHLPSDWTGTFPDLIDRIAMRERPAVFDPSTSVFPSIGILHAWDAEFPDMVWKQHQTPQGATIWLVPQLTSADDTDCIVFSSVNVTYPLLASESLMGSTVTEESLTRPDGTTEVIC